MQPLDDMTPEELDQRNAATIAFLHHVSGRGQASFETLTIEAQSTEQAQVIASVRQRLLGLEGELVNDSHMTQVSPLTDKVPLAHSGKATNSTAGISPWRKRRSRENRMGLLVAVAMLLLIVGSSVFVFKSMQQSRTSQSLTPGSTTGVTATQTTTPLSLQQQAQKLVQQFHHEAATWGNAHLYHDAYDGHNYALDDAYLQNGLGAKLDQELHSARTQADYGAVIQAANNALFNLHMLEADYNDHTPSNVTHNTDLQMMQHYQLQGQVVMISLVEQTMRVYQNGQLVQAFSITTGRPELPSTPGTWQVLYRSSPTTLVSAFPHSSPYWFPRTQVNYIMFYHAAGNFIVDAPWRATYGPGTQFPHKDAGGNAFANNGTEGEIDMAEPDAMWLYTHTSLKTTIAIY